MAKHERSILQELERERTRIARDLHAGAGQPLSGIKLNLELLEDSLRSVTGETKELLGRLRVLTEAALDQVRAISHRLQPPDWQQLSTEEAFRRLIRLSGVTEHFRSNVEIEQLPLATAHSTKVALYRCAQEGITNALRHSEATAFSVILATRGDFAELLISDNGKGFDIGSSQGSGGIGLQSIREQVSALGGSASITSGPEGTAIIISLPLREDE